MKIKRLLAAGLVALFLYFPALGQELPAPVSGDLVAANPISGEIVVLHTRACEDKAVIAYLESNRAEIDAKRDELKQPRMVLKHATVFIPGAPLQDACWDKVQGRVVVVLDKDTAAAVEENYFVPIGEPAKGPEPMKRDHPGGDKQGT